jgi:hypothetical protein
MACEAVQTPGICPSNVGKRPAHAGKRFAPANLRQPYYLLKYASCSLSAYFSAMASALSTRSLV